MSLAYALTSEGSNGLASKDASPLTFPYKVGSEFSRDRISSLINFINSAATLYRNDIKQSLLYVQSSMNAAYVG